MEGLELLCAERTLTKAPPLVSHRDSKVAGCEKAKNYRGTVQLMLSVLLLQLARIQTDSVADKLKELFPDIHLEIGESHHCLYWKIIWRFVFFFQVA